MVVQTALIAAAAAAATAAAAADAVAAGGAFVLVVTLGVASMFASCKAQSLDRTLIFFDTRDRTMIGRPTDILQRLLIGRTLEMRPKDAADVPLALGPRCSSRPQKHWWM